MCCLEWDADEVGERYPHVDPVRRAQWMLAVRELLQPEPSMRVGGKSGCSFASLESILKGRGW